MSILGNSLEGRVTLSRVSVCLFILNPQDNCMNVYATCRTVLRGSGVLRKGQHLWNISEPKETRVDPKVVLE